MATKRTSHSGTIESAVSPASGSAPRRRSDEKTRHGSQEHPGGVAKSGKKKREETLRKAAENRLPALPASPEGQSCTTPEEIIHELRVHQIELEMQNEALRESRIALEESRDRYAGLYEFAPVGYLTLSKEAIILEANLTVASILGVDRQKLIGCRFARYVVPADRTIWHEHLIRMMRKTGRHTGELHLARNDGSAAVSRVESIRMERGNAEQVILVAVSDITDLVRAEENLVLKSRDLDELRVAYQTIANGQKQLRRNETQLTEALAEKEVLLAEIHHRVKNNLTAFISLLSLDGACENTDGARELRKDLQNRARSMALIHETLYQTRKFSSVDMELYLRTLVEQIASSYSAGSGIRTVVSARDVPLDLSRATTAGLIVNELVTNSFKYAFPPGFDCWAERGEPCTIRVSATCDNGSYVLTVADNGIGLPAGFDPLASRSLGLKLVNFLARHQLRAETSFGNGKGTEFIFSLNQYENCS